MDGTRVFAEKRRRVLKVCGEYHALVYGQIPLRALIYNEESSVAIYSVPQFGRFRVISFGVRWGLENKGGHATTSSVLVLQNMLFGIHG